MDNKEKKKLISHTKKQTHIFVIIICCLIMLGIYTFSNQPMTFSSFLADMSSYIVYGYNDFHKDNPINFSTELKNRDAAGRTQKLVSRDAYIKDNSLVYGLAQKDYQDKYLIVYYYYDTFQKYDRSYSIGEDNFIYMRGRKFSYDEKKQKWTDGHGSVLPDIIAADAEKLSLGITQRNIANQKTQN